MACSPAGVVNIPWAVAAAARRMGQVALLVGLLSGPGERLRAEPREEAAATQCPRLVISADPSYPPLHWYDGQQLRGASIELTARVLNQLGLAYEFRYVGPWVRVLKVAREGGVDMVVTLKNTEDRREFLAFPDTPAFANPVAVFAHKAHRFPYSGVADLLPRRGGVSKGNRFGGAQGSLLERTLKLEEGLDAAHNFRKLALGRIDYFITGLYAGQAQQQILPDADQFMVLEPALTSTPNYMAFVRSSPCVRHLAAFDAALAQLVAQGDVPRVLDASLRQWVSSQRPQTPPARVPSR